MRRHPGARRITLRITPDGLVVTAPPHVSDRVLRGAVTDRADWIADALAQRAAAAAAPLVPGDRIPLLGGAVVLGAGPGPRVRRRGALLEIPTGAPPGPALERWYRAEARRHFRALVAGWAPRIGVSPTGLTIRDQRTRWGSASARGTLSFNWRLVMADPEIAEYVAVHELVHLRHMDHSPAFWSCVAVHLPAYRGPREWLRRHGTWLQTGPHALPPATGDGWPVG